MRQTLTVMCLALCLTLCQALNMNGTNTDEARALAERLSCRLTEKVEFEQIAAAKDGADVFTLQNRGDKVVVGGNNANSMAVGLNRYLNKYCKTTVSWYGDIDVELPAELPPVDEERVESRVPQRFFLNYCTYGYTMTFWGWREWERFIDWMALNGVNLPLAIAGQEAVWQKVWMRMGMTDSETRNYFTGPSYLPWHRMANIDHWCGPLPQEWIDSQVELQQQILRRMRSLNMRPVLPAFAGHVPGRIKELYPRADIKQLTPWNYFPEECYTYFMNSEDPMFAKIQRMFIEEQTALFGTDHIYGFDPFNEVDPPVWDPKYIGKVTRHMFRSVSAVDKKAEWLLMGWFYYFNKNWTTERVKAMMDAVPRGRLTILDYHCDMAEVWRQHDSFGGQNYLWCYLGNFGGNSIMQGNPGESGRRLEEALRQGGKGLKGVGCTLEGLDLQQMPYEDILSHAWNYGTDDTQRVNEIADRHADCSDKKVRQAWDIIYNQCYTQANGGHGDLINTEPMFKRKNIVWRPSERDDKAIARAARILLSVDKAESNAMRTDIVVLVRQLLNDKFVAEKQAFDHAMTNKDEAAMRQHATMMRELLSDVDRINSHLTHSTMDKWVGLARDYGDTERLKDYYEMNATRLITTWGPNLNDYANRSLSGLIRTYYTPRWEIYLEEAFRSVREGRDFDDDANHRRQEVFSKRYRYTPPREGHMPGTDLLTQARLIMRKYQF